jgi:hypothetical protein
MLHFLWFGVVLFLISGSDTCAAMRSETDSKPGILKSEIQTEDRKSRIEAQFARYPKLFREKYRPSILQGVVVLGMNPREAKLAGGAFAYQVQADPKRWTASTNPLKIIAAQAEMPDDSEIWMTFRNTTQLPASGLRSFRVYFKRGQAVEIEMLKEASGAAH